MLPPIAMVMTEIKMTPTKSNLHPKPYTNSLDLNPRFLNFKLQ
jgi:hypothetical protein